MKVNLKVDVETICPCGGVVQVGYLDGNPCVTHTLPYCEEFEEKDIIAYIHYLNQQKLH